MTTQLSLSPCSRYVVCRPLDLAKTVEEIQHRCFTLRAFAKERGTRRILYDMRQLAFNGDSRHFEAFAAHRASYSDGPWTMAWVSSLEVPTHSSEYVSGLADLFDAIGQDAQFFMDYDQAIAWITAAPD